MIHHFQFSQVPKFSSDVSGFRSSGIYSVKKYFHRCWLSTRFGISRVIFIITRGEKYCFIRYRQFQNNKISINICLTTTFIYLYEIYVIYSVKTVTQFTNFTFLIWYFYDLRNMRWNLNEIFQFTEDFSKKYYIWI